MAKKTQLYQLPKSFKKGGYLYAKRYKSPLFYDDAKKRATQLKARGKKVIIKSAYETGKIFGKIGGKTFVLSERANVRYGEVYVGKKIKK